MVQPSVARKPVALAFAFVPQKMAHVTSMLSSSALPTATASAAAVRLGHRRGPIRSKCAAAGASASSSSSTTTTATTAKEVTADKLKNKILRLSALTDRGQLLFQQAAYAPLDKYNAASKAEFLECVVGTGGHTAVRKNG